MRTKKVKDGKTQVTFRLGGDLRRFYEEAAEKERRKLSDMIRIVLEDHKPIIEQRQQA